MIEILINKDDEDRCISFSCKGHALYDSYGKDIVCSAVSALVIGTINSIEKFTEDGFSLNYDEEEGKIEFSFDHLPGHDSQLLCNSMLSSLYDVQEQYGEFIRIKVLGGISHA